MTTEINEEYSVDKNDVVIDKQTGDPILQLKKSSFNGKYSSSLHPDFKAMFPHIGALRQAAVDTGLTKTAAAGLASRVMSQLEKHNFKSPYKIVETDDANISNIQTPEGENIATQDTREYDNKFKLHPDFINKHGLSDSIVAKHNRDINGAMAYRRHSTQPTVFDLFHAIQGAQAEASKPKVVAHVKTVTGKTHVHEIQGNPEEASQAVEDHFKSTGNRGDASVTRHSPTSFTMQKGNNVIHSHVIGNNVISHEASI